ncbi:MAG: bifunctional aspartate kinase/homoserine dehydrogenase II [Enterobacteriaceae bacterium]
MTAKCHTGASQRRQLHKFGGSSLQDVVCYQRVARILAQYGYSNDMVVVSAAGKTTNQLIAWLEQCQTDPSSATDVRDELYHYQLELINGLLPEEMAKPLADAFLADVERLSLLLNEPVHDALYAEVVGHGEIWSARLMAACLTQHGLSAVWWDAREFLRTERAPLPQIDDALSRALLQEKMAGCSDKIAVITGFIARNAAGETVLLGRNGSDYSATQIAALAEVIQVIIWSDVAGVYSADPRKVKDACLLPLLRLDEASELSRLAAPVLHSRTLQPVAGSNIDLQLRCSYQPESGSTRIERILASGMGAKVVTSHEQVCLIDFQVDAQADFAQVVQALQQFVQHRKIIPLVLGLHPDRHLLQLCYTTEIAQSAYDIVQQADLPGKLQLRHGFSLVALVGAGVCNTPLHCHRFYQQLADQPVEFFWQSEENISLVAVLRNGSGGPLIQGLHHSLFRAEKEIGLVLFGKGNSGSRWLELFAKEQQTLSARSGFEFILAGVVDSHASCLDYRGVDASRVLAFFNEEAQPHTESELLTWMQAHPFDDLIILDVTASAELANRYLTFANLGFHVISANKVAGSSASGTYRQIRDAFAKTGRHWLYNATVGAGLPINYAIRDLRDSGDIILSISGIFSGTLSWLFLQYNGEIPFTELVRQAWQKGLTEPDPRDDLSGRDVMRKLVILAREAGYDIEPDQVRVESLVPEAAALGPVDNFFADCHNLNQQMSQRLSAAKELGMVLRYVARFSANGQARVGVEAISQDHPLASLLPGDNIFAVESRWYRDNPLIIRGPGAGRDVTAGAIQSDLNRLAQLL